MSLLMFDGVRDRGGGSPGVAKEAVEGEGRRRFRVAAHFASRRCRRAADPLPGAGAAEEGAKRRGSDMKVPLVGCGGRAARAHRAIGASVGSVVDDDDVVRRAPRLSRARVHVRRSGSLEQERKIQGSVGGSSG